jgi:hopene-associated glycosyltransferase HpnB
MNSGGIVLLIWLYLVLARGRFWQLGQQKPAGPLQTNPRVAIVIPARDEAESIQACIASCAAQQYPGEFQIYLVDDHSADGTADLARKQSDRIAVIQAAPLPPGWTGKLWAVHCGLEQARTFQPDYVLLTDADIIHSPATLSGLVARAEENNLDLASYMVKLRCQSFAEKALIPAFVYFFFQLYPPRWIEDPRSSTAGAAGGCILIRNSALERIGGVASIKSALIDDCALAARVKGSGGKIWLGVTQESHSIRSYNTFREIRRMISRTAFSQLNYSAWLLAGTILGLIATYIAPPLLLITGNKLAGAACVLMMLSYMPMLRFYGRPRLWSVCLPLIAMFYTAATIDSALRHWKGAGGEWKGRFQQ